MIILSYFPEYFENKKDLENALIDIKKFFIELAESDTSLSSIYLSHNSNKSDTVIGDMELIYGSEVITEELLGLQFDIGPKSFFQTNSRGAEVLYTLVKDFAHKDTFNKGIVLDLYG
jgi:tRNA/tmRNA/rRNA uracil-C5-methylase (TrmA/RlmC/RlmD family)